MIDVGEGPELSLEAVDGGGVETLENLESDEVLPLPVPGLEDLTGGSGPELAP